MKERPYKKVVMLEFFSSSNFLDFVILYFAKMSNLLFTVSSVPMRNVTRPSLRMRSMSMEEYDMPKLRQRSMSGSEDHPTSPLAASPVKQSNVTGILYHPHQIIYSTPVIIK